MDNASDRVRHQREHEGDVYRRIELITGERRRRRWTAEEKAALVAESFRPGINVSALARRHGVNRGLLQTWRRAATSPSAECAMTFVPLCVEDATTSPRRAEPPVEATAEVVAASTLATGPGTIEIESDDMRVRFSGRIDVAALRVVLGRVGRRG